MLKTQYQFKTCSNKMDQSITVEGKSIPTRFMCEKSDHRLSSFLFSCHWDQELHSVRMIVCTSRSSFLDHHQVHRYSRSNSRQGKVNVCQAVEFACTFRAWSSLHHLQVCKGSYFIADDYTAKIMLSFSYSCPYISH